MNPDFDTDNGEINLHEKYYKPIPVETITNKRRSKKMTIKIRPLTLIQLLLKCLFCVSTVVFLRNQLAGVGFIKSIINYFATKANYGMWIFHLIGVIVAIVWQIVYEYTRAVRNKNNAQRIEHR